MELRPSPLDRPFGVRPVVAGSLLVTSLAVGSMPLMPTPDGLWLAGVAFGRGLAVLGVASGLYIFTLAGYSTGALVGMYRLSGDVMQVFGPVLVGPALDAFGFTVSFMLMADFGLLALACMLLRPTSPPARCAARTSFDSQARSGPAPTSSPARRGETLTCSPSPRRRRVGGEVCRG